MLSGGKTGIFGPHGEGVIWLHLAECYLQLEKYPTAGKCLQQALTKFSEALPEASDPSIYLVNRGSGDGSLLAEIQDIIHPFALAGLLNDEQKSVFVKIMSLFAAKGSPEF